MKLLLSALLSLSILFSFGQSKLVKKSERLFKKAKYEKCIEKTKKYLTKEKKSPDLQYYIVQSNFALYRKAEEKKRLSFLRKTISNWERLEKYNTAHIDYSILENELIESIENELSNASFKKLRKTNYYHQKLAEVFHDTTEYYKSQHPELNPIEQKTVDHIVDTSLSRFNQLNAPRREILLAAKKVIGTKYKYAGTDSTGFDCSGFTQYAYHSAGIEIPHNANMQSKLGDTIDISDAQAGDLIFFGSGTRAYHAGIIYSNNDENIELVHCTSRGVRLQTSDDENTKYWLKHMLRIQRIIPLQQSNKD